MRVLHLVGSPTSDFFAELSQLYARGALAALGRATDPDGDRPGTEPHEHHIAYVTPDGRWRFPADLTPGAISAAAPMTLAGAVSRLVDLAPHVAVPQLFCLAGMTTYRSLLDLLRIPFVGNDAEVMALGAHKARARAVVAAAGVAVPVGEVLRPGQRPSLAPPVVVKPMDADNSVGVHLVRDTAGLPEALDAAFAHSSEVLLEQYVELGREVRCGVLERGGELVVLPLEEYAVDPVTKPIRGPEDKLARAADGGLTLVAKDAAHAWIVDEADPVTHAVADAARACHAALGCRDYSLFDFRIDPAGQPFFLEAGLYCSFAPTSVIAVMAAAAGITLQELFGTTVANALISTGGGTAPPRAT